MSCDILEIQSNSVSLNLLVVAMKSVISSTYNVSDVLYGTNQISAVSLAQGYQTTFIFFLHQVCVNRKNKTN